MTTLKVGDKARVKQDMGVAFPRFPFSDPRSHQSLEQGDIVQVENIEHRLDIDNKNGRAIVRYRYIDTNGVRADVPYSIDASFLEPAKPSHKKGDFVKIVDGPVTWSQCSGRTIILPAGSILEICDGVSTNGCVGFIHYGALNNYLRIGVGLVEPFTYDSEIILSRMKRNYNAEDMIKISDDSPVHIGILTNGRKISGLNWPVERNFTGSVELYIPSNTEFPSAKAIISKQWIVPARECTCTWDRLYNNDHHCRCGGVQQ